MLTIAVFSLGFCGPSEETKQLQEQANNIFGTIPEQMPGAEEDTKQMVKLGEKLYFDTRLSVNGEQSCNSCHRIDNNFPGDDGRATSPGAIEGRFGNRNAPTVLNAGFHIAQFWDGRAPTLKAQAKGPVVNPKEMGMPSNDQVVQKLAKVEEYQNMFKKAFSDAEKAITFDHMAEAIAAFERTLTTQDRFDDFQNGDYDALTKTEREGLDLFMNKAGCVSCHSGPMLGGDSYRKMGLVNAYENKKDLGRYKVTKKEEDKYVFKVPSLRNVALTAPYFHDGKVKTLDKAVEKMAYLQLGKELSDKEVGKIVAFLESLSGKNRVDGPKRNKKGKEKDKSI